MGQEEKETEENDRIRRVNNTRGNIPEQESIGSNSGDKQRNL